MYQCGTCGNAADKATPSWNETNGWQDTCERCRLVLTLTESGRIKFIKVGG
jgi:hypothetical protein